LHKICYELIARIGIEMFNAGCLKNTSLFYFTLKIRNMTVWNGFKNGAVYFIWHTFTYPPAFCSFPYISVCRPSETYRVVLFHCYTVLEVRFLWNTEDGVRCFEVFENMWPAVSKWEDEQNLIFIHPPAPSLCIVFRIDEVRQNGQ
jgi:hypothetical protein